MPLDNYPESTRCTSSSGDIDSLRTHEGGTILILKRGGASGGVAVGISLASFVYPIGFPVAERNDPIMKLIRTSHLIVSGVSQRVFFGSLNDDPSAEDVVSEGLAPRQSDYNAQRDVDKYSSALGSVFDQPNFSGQNAVAENQVLHASLIGSVRLKHKPLYTWGPNCRKVYWNGFELKLPDQEISNTYFPYYKTVINTPPPYGYNGGYNVGSRNLSNISGGTVLSESFYSLAKRLVGIEEKPSPYPYLGSWNTIPIEVHRMFSASPGTGGTTGVAEVTFNDGKLKWKSISYAVDSMSESIHTITFTPVRRLNPGAGYPSNAAGRQLFDVHVSWDSEINWFTRTDSVPQAQYYGWKESPPNAAFPREYHRSYLLSEHGGMPWNFLYSEITPPTEVIPSIFRKDGYLTAVEEQFSANLGFFRPAVMLSFADAIAQHRATTTNWIEVIAELDELLTLAPSLKDILSLAMSIPRGAWVNKRGESVTKLFYKKSGDGWEFALKLGDLFSSTHLLRAFGWRPAVENTREVTSKLDKLGAAMQALQSPMTLRGKKTFTLDALGYENVRLTVRSKVRVGGMEDATLGHFMNLDSVGLAPSSKNLWALVKWSWLIDMGIAMSTRYDILDSIIIGLMIDVYILVHSFTAYVDIPDDVLASHGVEADPSDPPQIKVYAREVSRHVPMIFGGYDYAAPVRPPDKGIIAAILWQLLRKPFK